MRPLILLLALLTLPTIIMAAPSPGAAAPPPATANAQARIIDGDTLVVDGRTWRLWGIDAPEAAQTCLDAANAPYACGSLASAHLRELVTSAGPVTCAERGHDRYGRTIGLCRTPLHADLGRLMVLEGWAVAFIRYSRDYVDDEAEARQNKRGLWSGTFDMPWDWRASRPSPAARPYQAR